MKDLAMNPNALVAWISLYIAVGSCALICAVLAALVTMHELWSGMWRPSSATRFQMALALPKVWLRWQRNYLFGAPVVLLIGLAFAWYLGFDVLWHIEPTG